MGRWRLRDEEGLLPRPPSHEGPPCCPAVLPLRIHVYLKYSFFNVSAYDTFPLSLSLLWHFLMRFINDGRLETGRWFVLVSHSERPRSLSPCRGREAPGLREVKPPVEDSKS